MISALRISLTSMTQTQICSFILGSLKMGSILSIRYSEITFTIMTTFITQFNLMIYLVRLI